MDIYNGSLLQWYHPAPATLRKPSHSARRTRSRMHRQSSLTLIQPLSLCLKLKELVDRIEIKQFRYTIRHSYLPVADHEQQKGDHQAVDLQEDSHFGVPAEESTDPLLIQEHRYPSLRALRTDTEIGDGLWLCCHCRHENILRHFQGSFPFKYLRCNRCDRVLCSGCQTTEILSSLPYGMIHAPQPPEGKEVRYLHICTSCGLSHRAEMEETTLDFYGVTCAGCGASSYGDWPRYHIGSTEPYRRDPDASYAQLVEQKATRASNLARRRSEDDQPPSRLSFKNPG